jgi:hypothetical protein
MILSSDHRLANLVITLLKNSLPFSEIQGFKFQNLEKCNLDGRPLLLLSCSPMDEIIQNCSNCPGGP